VEFVDSNVVLYAYDTSAGPRHEAARGLMSRLGRARAGALSVQVLQEFYVNATAKVAKRLEQADAARRVQALSRWSVHSPMASDVSAAITISGENQISFWDAMIVRSASELGCTVLWTEDLNPGQTIAGVLIRSPFAAAG
jgi:predicted nucleic acid-binding protein